MAVPGKQFLIKVREILVLKPYYTLCESQGMWFFVNRKNRAKYLADTHAVSALSVRISDDLTRDGIAFSSLEELFPGQDVLPKLQAEAARLREYAKIRPKKPFLLELMEEDATLDMQDPFLQVAFSQPMLDPINRYLGIWSKFYYQMLAVTLPGGDNAVARGSQKWHRDPEDAQMCKFFIYLSDVDESAGPFTYVRGTQRGGPYRSYFPQKRPIGSYPSNEDVQKNIPQERHIVATGKAGSVIFADTSGLHRGGYATHKERIMYTSGYFSKAASFPTRYVLPKDKGSLAHLADQVTFALELSA